ncbi:amino acid ABC transporter permease [Nonomuraea angiospora]|uniref:Glutamate transport system permease protein n=1 Tax=Nonomuraea angiospora TaxID=46172 RepID=A0ABR9ML86_9ACTN|nr:amino acid ABC transporter permease [Nonomuraea angiospora]MBE1593709.1 glutamate transport system permease protein [Nonomuraea angiospora]MDX3110734.1 amino acid ABC transporter permease [Nonomuraea angiospora]
MEALLFERDTIFAAFWMTIRLTAVSALGSLVLGTLLTAMRVAPLASLRGAANTYVTMMRNTPLTLVLMFTGLGVGAQLGVELSDDIATNNFWLAVIGLTAYTSAFVCEALRSGLNTVPVGQAEAARSLGLGFTKTLGLITLPQAFRAVVAPLGSIMIALTKNTTIALVVGVGEASVRMREMIETYGDQVLEIFLGFAAGFVLLCLPMGLLFGWLSRRMAVAR